MTLLILLFQQKTHDIQCNLVLVPFVPLIMPLIMTCLMILHIMIVLALLLEPRKPKVRDLIGTPSTVVIIPYNRIPDYFQGLI